MNKITLITPPDYYENSNPSILLIGFDDSQQDESSEWLAKNDFEADLNLYYYQGEDSIEWLLYALARSNCTFVNADCDYSKVQNLLSYILSRPNVWYTTKDEELRQVFNHINGHYVNTVTEFFEGVFNDQR